MRAPLLIYIRKAFYYRKKIMQIVIVAFFSVESIYAATSNDAKDYVAEIEEYLNNLKTFESDFVQRDRSGRCSTGHFFLKRPFLMKMTHGNPPNLVVIARGKKIVYYDRELKEKTETTIYSSPLSFFLEPRIELRKNVKVLFVRDDGDAVSIKFCRQNAEDDGTVMLLFSKKPITLRRWVISSNGDDSLSGVSTEISLFNWKSGHSIPNEEFQKFH
ncbi:MAG: outer membrane lipoprotein carrier protein LolA [Holosporaceae bacterium]|jgi:outer membrane lipoprotein-sorting protein|nr:outer membrane lipoprotein carrier protein LolA [Holosporaceae bacterium]